MLIYLHFGFKDFDRFRKQDDYSTSDGRKMERKKA